MQKKLRLTLAALAACSLAAGCTTTPNGWRKKAPSLDVVSAKSADEVIRCVSDVWQSHGWTPSYLPRRTGGTITLMLPGVFGPSGQVGAMLDVDKAGHGSTVRFYGMKALAGGSKEKAEIIGCI